jgi:hypothetical protein
MIAQMVVVTKYDTCHGLTTGPNPIVYTSSVNVRASCNWLSTGGIESPNVQVPARSAPVNLTNTFNYGSIELNATHVDEDAFTADTMPVHCDLV